MKNTITLLLFIIIAFEASIAQIDCKCYSVENIEISSLNTLGLTLHNDCDNHAYLNLYIISSTSPYDTLARKENLGAAFPIGINTTHYLETKMTEVPVFGTYRVEIGYGEISPENCDSLKFSSNFTRINNYLDTDFSIYPIPFDRFLFIDIQHGITFLKTINMNGYSNLFQIENNRIDLGLLKSGLYILELYNNQSELVGRKKIIKK